MKLSRPWSTLLVLVAIGASFFLAAVSPAHAAPHDKKRLLVHYMPWYETPEVRGRWGSHWTGHQKQHNPEVIGEDGLPDIWSHYHPLIGLYDSADPAVLECQLLQMKLAGADGVIVDWYGIADAADYPPIHEATQALFEATAKLGMTFSVCYEDRTVELMVNRNLLDTNDIQTHLSETIAWLDENWFKADHYEKIDGQPLLLNFGPIYVKDAGVWKAAMTQASPQPKFFALHHLWQDIEADGGFTWIHKDVFDGDPDFSTVRERLTGHFTHSSEERDQVIVSAYPGFHDVYANSFGYLDHRDGKTLQQALAVGMAGDWPIIQLATWNDYGEGTILEPTHEFGYRFLEIIQDARRRESRGKFPFVADDLKLPARLLQLRRAANAPADDLDAIAVMLRDGNAQEALKAIEAAEALPPASTSVSESPATGYTIEINLPYREGGDLTPYMASRCRLDVYHPTDLKGFPTVVWFHAGGLTSGSRFIPDALQKQGLAVVSVDYRLSPKVKAPAYIEDAAAAVAWTMKNIERYGGDPERIYLAGHSAGGYLINMVGLDRRWLGAHDLDPDDLAGLASFSGHTITHFTVRSERGIPGTRAVVDDLAPQYHVRADAPPMLIVTGDRDKELLGRYEENAYFWRMMKEVGHPAASIHEGKGLDHGAMPAAGFPLLLDMIRRDGD